MGSWPQLRESSTVRAGQAPGTVVRCSLRDVFLSGVATSIVHFYAGTLPAPKLIEGLAKALAAVPIFGGRMRTAGDDMEIVCTDEGVPIEFYTIDEPMSEAIGRAGSPSSGLANHCEALKARDGGLPLLTVRVTEFTDGTALCSSFHHALGDLQTYMVFMQAWSAAVEGLPVTEAVVVTDRDAYIDGVLPPGEPGKAGFRLPDAEEAAVLNAEIQASARANRTVQIYFGADEVARMRDAFVAEAGRKLSTNDVLAAHISTALRDLDDYEEPRLLFMPVNVRPRLGLPPTVVGNILGDFYLTCAPDTTPPQFAAQIRETLEGADVHPTFRADLRLIEQIGRDRITECIPFAFDPPHRALTISNWTRFGLTDITFGGGKPVLVSPTTAVSLPWTGWLVDGFDGAGVLLTLVVPVRFAGKLRGADGKARLHRYRTSEDTLPPQATAGRVI